MTPDQLAKFEAWAKSQKYNLSKKFGLHEYNTTRIANAAWQACCDANAIDQPADDERERLRDLLRRCLPHVEVYGNLRAEIEAVLGEERA